MLEPRVPGNKPRPALEGAGVAANTLAQSVFAAPHRRLEAAAGTTGAKHPEQNDGSG